STGFIPYILPPTPNSVISTGFIPYILPPTPISAISTGFIPYILHSPHVHTTKKDVRSPMAN
ncbi:hypothetical protein, partial [Paenibacillus sp. FSL H8-237]|uniref:hypothetical protein n=1 Tax=Paenibacillus sp. FSL H8-237 TaxID=1227350 RepID=UPI001F3CD975